MGRKERGRNCKKGVDKKKGREEAREEERQIEIKKTLLCFSVYISHWFFINSTLGILFQSRNRKPGAVKEPATL